MMTKQKSGTKNKGDVNVHNDNAAGAVENNASLDVRDIINEKIKIKREKEASSGPASSAMLLPNETRRRRKQLVRKPSLDLTPPSDLLLHDKVIHQKSVLKNRRKLMQRSSSLPISLLSKKHIPQPQSPSFHSSFRFKETSYSITPSSSSLLSSHDENDEEGNGEIMQKKVKETKEGKKSMITSQPTPPRPSSKKKICDATTASSHYSTFSPYYPPSLYPISTTVNNDYGGITNNYIAKEHGAGEELMEQGESIPLLFHSQNVQRKISIDNEITCDLLDDRYFPKKGILIHRSDTDDTTANGSFNDADENKMENNKNYLFSTPVLKADEQGEKSRLIQIASAYLCDYSHSRPPSLPPDSDYVTYDHLFWHSLRFSNFWNGMLGIATICLFGGSLLEGVEGDENYCSDKDRSHGCWKWQNTMKRNGIFLFCIYFPVMIFTMDMIMMRYLFGQQRQQQIGTITVSGNDERKKKYRQSPRLQFTASTKDGGSVQAYRADISLPTSATTIPIHARKSRSRWWAYPLIIFLVTISIEAFVVVIVPSSHHSQRYKMLLWSSSLKPIVLFYTSPKARNALDAMNRVSRVVFKVLFIELFVIFTFAAVARNLYGDSSSVVPAVTTSSSTTTTTISSSASFADLYSSFITMFEISTLVDTPGPWMSIYNQYKSSAFFFAMFLITCVFYLHSLVLSVVFQSYMEGLVIIRQHTLSDKDLTLRLAFQTLYRIEGSYTSVGYNSSIGCCDGNCNDEVVIIPIEHIRKVLTTLKPSYEHEKINALLNLVNPANAGFIDYDSFRLGIPKAMSTSIRTSPDQNGFSSLFETFSVLIAIVNLLYVIMASSKYHSLWWNRSVIPIGYTISMACIGDLLVRLAVHNTHWLNEVSRPNTTFDAFAFLAIVVSLTGMLLHSLCRADSRSLQLLVMGRAIDMVRCLRLFNEARCIVRRSGELLPHIVGPVVLLATAMHILAYIGIAIWGGLVSVGNNPDIIPYYDLNNFNDYPSGLLTMFQLLVGNDWQHIADVFILPDHGYANHWVYPWFIGINLLMVSILLNTLVAFFVGAFVTKSSWRSENNIKHAQGYHKNANVGVLPKNIRFERGVLQEDDENSCTSQNNNIILTETEDFDDLMKTVAGVYEHETDTAKDCCHLLELFENLVTGMQDLKHVGYLVSCQQTMSRYGNRRFQELVRKVMDDETMHLVIGQMHDELVRSPDGHKSSVHRSYKPLGGYANIGTLELSASLLREGSSVALFLAKMH